MRARPRMRPRFALEIACDAEQMMEALREGLAQLSLGSRPWALLIPLVTAALAAFVYGAAFIGQGLGADEMYELRSFLDDAVEAAIEKGRVAPRTPLDSARL